MDIAPIGSKEQTTTRETDGFIYPVWREKKEKRQRSVFYVLPPCKA